MSLSPSLLDTADIDCDLLRSVGQLPLGKTILYPFSNSPKALRSFGSKPSSMFTLAQRGLSTPSQRGEGDTDPFTHCPNTEQNITGYGTKPTFSVNIRHDRIYRTNRTIFNMIFLFGENMKLTYQHK